MNKATIYGCECALCGKYFHSITKDHICTQCDLKGFQDDYRGFDAWFCAVLAVASLALIITGLFFY